MLVVCKKKFRLGEQVLGLQGHVQRPTSSPDDDGGCAILVQRDCRWVGSIYLWMMRGRYVNERVQ